MKRQTVHPSKVARVAALKQILDESKSVAIVDYAGLKVSQATQLRREVKQAGGEMKVEKNTLFKLAAGKSDMTLEGLSAFIFSKSDEVAAIKVLADFMKKNSVGTFKGGMLGDRVLTAAEIAALAKIPGKEALVAQLLSTLQSPASKLVYSLSYNISQLARVLDAIRQKGVN